MDYLPIFEPGRSRLGGGAEICPAPQLLAGRAVALRRPGDSVTFKAKGRCLGLVFVENPHGATVEITVAGKRYRLDLWCERQRSRVLELALPSGWVAVPVTVRLGAPRSRASRRRGFRLRASRRRGFRLRGSRLRGSARASPEGRQANEAWLQGAYVADCRAGELAERIRGRVDPDPYSDAQLNQLTDVLKWYDRDWVAARAALDATPGYTPPDFVHRKAWEWVQTVYGLDCLGMIRPNVRALGVGVGWEPLSFFLANRVAEVVATDLYPVDDEWTGREGNPRILEDPKEFAPYPYPEDRLTFLRMDGTHLDFPDESFDVVWSCSSIEHFGGHQGATRSMREIERVLRPGGVASVITEYVLPDDPAAEHSTFDAEYFNLRCIYEYLLRPVPRLRLVQMPDLSLPDYYRRRPVKMPDEAEAPHGGIAKPHIVVRIPDRADITSIALFLRKTGTVPGGRGWRSGKAR